MNEDRYDAGKNSGERMADDPAQDKFQYSLDREEQVLRSISARAPLLEILNEICSALDCQLGNVASNIFLLADEANEIAAMARIAAFFGLSSFCSAGIFGENGERLGSLQMYCCPMRSPSARESQLIERAARLAAMAIQVGKQAAEQEKYRVPEKRPAQGTAFERPAFPN